MTPGRKKLPAMEPLRSLTFPRLDGGLDLGELDYRVAERRSPEMKNLWWQDGILQCRDGQRLLWQPETPEQGFACWRELFRDRLIFHAGSRLYAAAPDQFAMSPAVLLEGVPENRGIFFRHGAYLYYKNRGGFYRLGGSPLTAENVAELAYVPTVLRDADPLAPEAAAAAEQPNRLTGLRRVCYRAVEAAGFRLPRDGETVRSVTLDGAPLAPEAYRVDGGFVELNQPVSGEVAVVYAVASAGEEELLQCCYAGVFGGGRDLCILLAGSPSRPNGVFWTSGDPTYWPGENILGVGDAADAVTGFGRQYGDILALKERSLWRLDLETRQGAPSLSAAPVSDLAGCDLPGTAALIGNNMVFCSRDKGVFQVRSSNAVYETNVRCLSTRVHGNSRRGLLRDLRTAGHVTAFDDGSRYWLCADDHAYLWDYSISDFADPSWFYLEGVAAAAFFRDGAGRLYHLDGEGRLSLFDRSFSDYGKPIEKLYRFPTLNFGTYDRRKHVESVLLSLRADTDTEVTVRYDADGLSRTDPTPARCRAWRLSPRDLRNRCLRLSPFAFIFRRRPCLRRVQHFSMTLENGKVGSDLAIVSAQVFYRLAEREG